MGESKVFTNHGENWHDLPSPESQEQEEQRMEEWLGQGRKKGIKGLGEFSPGWSHQPGLKIPHLSWLVALGGINGPVGHGSTFISPGPKTGQDK
jgi:hypothetical protein